MGVEDEKAEPLAMQPAKVPATSATEEETIAERIEAPPVDSKAYYETNDALETRPGKIQAALAQHYMFRPWQIELRHLHAPRARASASTGADACTASEPQRLSCFFVYFCCHFFLGYV